MPIPAAERALRPDRAVRILLVEADTAVWARAETFFQQQLELVGARLRLQARRRLPERAVGFDLVSLDGRCSIAGLLDRPALLADLKDTPIVNLHADAPGEAYGKLRLLLDRAGDGGRADGIWVFPQSWMAPWFREALDFPELGLVAEASLDRLPPKDRPWERSLPSLPFQSRPLLPARG